MPRRLDLLLLSDSLDALWRLIIVELLLKPDTMLELLRLPVLTPSLPGGSAEVLDTVGIFEDLRDFLSWGQYDYATL